jgi:vacuolar-type H+-ATPase subunit I/STV1
MGNRTDDILNKIKAKARAAGQAAAHAADAAAEKAGKIYESTKLNFKLYELNGEIEEIQRKIGALVYAVHGGSESDQQELDELLKELDALNAEKAELKKKIALTKNCKVCPECDSLCKMEDQFCASCGHAF